MIGKRKCHALIAMLARRKTSDCCNPQDDQEPDRHSLDLHERFLQQDYRQFRQYLGKYEPRAGRAQNGIKGMAPQVGLEPTTLRLTAGCSAIELLRSGQLAAPLTKQPIECLLKISRVVNR